ncbi:MAG: PQQ-dependent sugar dehydrogenase [Pseudomonadota bacterium]
MKRRRFLTYSAAFAVLGSSGHALDTSAGRLEVARITGGLSTPWAFGFLPDMSVLVTERDGTLQHIGGGRMSPVAGVGQVTTGGQGGLLDLLVPADFARTRELFFTFAKAQGGGKGTAVARARLSTDGRRLEDWQVIYEIRRGSSRGRHFGSRLVEAGDGTLFVTVGDRGDRPSAQDLSVENGSVLRITRRGGVPGNNPFTKTQGARPAIWSWGHRNPQGAALDGQGRLWVVEHGARGGDELNLVRRGANFGWPVISYGRHYSGGKIGEGTEKPGMEQPVHYWDPSIAPSGLMFCSGRLFPAWRGAAFVGSLKQDYLSRIAGDPMREVEQIRLPGARRIRDVREAPDGAIWVLAAGNGSLYRLSK